MYQAGHPEFTVSAPYDSAAAALTLTVRQTQADTAPPDTGGVRFTTPAVFRAPLAIRVGTARATSWLAPSSIAGSRPFGSRESASRPPWSSSMTRTRCSSRSPFTSRRPGWPTSSHRHANLWNRSWAIAQLAARRGDGLAAAALAHAATSADYDLTRAEAAAALGRFTGEPVLPALETALADTSARVRKAAVEAIGNVGGARAAELVRARWSADSSDQVRAAALTAWARLAPDSARDAVAAGLRTKSYQEAIQNAAIAAVVRRPDSALVAGLEAIAGEQQLPVVALAALAARGDPSARAALARLVEDQRPWVRLWAREATSQGSEG